LQARAQALEKAARELRLSLPRESTRRTERELRGNLDFRQSVAGMEAETAALAAALAEVAERDKSLAQCAERAAELLARLRRWRNEEGGAPAPSKGKADDAAEYERAFDEDAAGQPALDEGAQVRWAETHSQSLSLHSTPLFIAPIFRRQI